MSISPPAIRSRKPTGEVPLPFVLLEGEPKSGRTWAALRLSASDRIGMTYLMDLADGIGDEYGRIPGVNFEILVPSGPTWTHADIIEQVAAVKAEAQRARDAGEKPVVLVIDTMTELWNSFKDWTTERAKESRTNRRKLAEDPNADISVPRHLWPATDKRYMRIINNLKTFPGIVVVTADAGEVSATGPDGQPIENQKAWSVSANKKLSGQVTIQVRMKQKSHPEVIAARSAINGMRPGRDEPRAITVPEAIGPDGNLVDWLVFTALGCDPYTKHVREVRDLTAGELTPEERGQDPLAVQFRDRALEAGQTFESLGALFSEVKDAGRAQALVIDDHNDEVRLGEFIIRLGNERRDAASTEPAPVVAPVVAPPSPVPAVPASAPDSARRVDLIGQIFTAAKTLGFTSKAAVYGDYEATYPGRLWPSATEAELEGYFTNLLARVAVQPVGASA